MVRGNNTALDAVRVKKNNTKKTRSSHASKTDAISGDDAQQPPAPRPIPTYVLDALTSSPLCITVYVDKTQMSIHDNNSGALT